MNKITKNEFIKVAQKLGNFYNGSDIALFAYARDCNCIEETYNFMCENKKTVGQVTEYIYDKAGRPNPQLVIINHETGEDCTKEYIKNCESYELTA